ncbi:uncharacterized protein LOC143227853 isoform X2 [Tachypleus tridentatus]|uniref:uncharacterized protein LOC143227853 isoform X2 n=1 Tax=Tachypleus tridentatus TaxID=6853 RepID=UPI003FD30F8F
MKKFLSLKDKFGPEESRNLHHQSKILSAPLMKVNKLPEVNTDSLKDLKKKKGNQNQRRSCDPLFTPCAFKFGA